MKKILLLLTVLLAVLVPARAQIEVGIDIKRRTFLRGEPIDAKVTIRNLSGHEITLSDTPSHQWFGFEVIRRGNTPVAPIDPNYKNAPVTIPVGETITRTVDILRLFPVNELAPYRIRATVYFEETRKYHASDQVPVDVSEGKKVWGQTVGVPAGHEGAGSLREFALISFQTPKELTLYGRVTDEATGTILATYPFGRILSGATPLVEFSNDNTLYAFHMTGPNVYALSKVGVNGEWLGQTMWHAPKGRAAVRKKADGTMVVVGASKNAAPIPGAAAPVVPKLSDAPPVAVPTR
jgi:hypothetical protein